MRIEPFCAWGDGPDVGINLVRSKEQADGFVDSHLHWFIDLTAVEARELAAKLISCAQQAEEMDRFVERENHE